MYSICACKVYVHIHMYVCLHIVPSKCDDIGAGFVFMMFWKSLMDA